METSGESTADPFIARKSQELAELQSELSTLQTSFQSLRTQQRPSSARRAKAEDPSHRFIRPSSALSKSILSRALKVEQHLGPEIWKDCDCPILPFMGWCGEVSSVASGAETGGALGG